MSRRSVVQRWPAVPAAAKTMPRTARSRSADGATIAPLLPPSSSSASAEARGDARADGPAHRHRSGRGNQRHAWIGDESLADFAAPPITTCEIAGGCTDVVGGVARNRLAGERGERRLLRRLPHHRVAADQRDAAFHAQTATGKLNAEMTPTGPERMPLLHQAVAGPLAGRSSCRKAGGDRPTANSQMSIISCTSPSASGVILPASSGDEVREVVLVFGQQLPEAADDRPALRCGHQPPVGERARRRRDRVVDLACGTGLQPADHLTSDRTPRHHRTIGTGRGVGPEPRQDLGSANSELAGNRKRRHQTLQREGVIDRDGRELSAGITRGPGGRCGANASARTVLPSLKASTETSRSKWVGDVVTVIVDCVAVLPSG